MSAADGIEIFVKVCAAVFDAAVFVVYVVEETVFHDPEVPTRYCKTNELPLEPLAPTSAAVQDTNKLLLFVEFTAIHIAPKLFVEEFRMLKPEEISFLILPVDAEALLFESTKSPVASVVKRDCGSPPNLQPCMDVG